MSSQLRWAKFFWADWAGDNCLSLCTLAAQGLWMRLLCIAALVLCKDCHDREHGLQE